MWKVGGMWVEWKVGEGEGTQAIGINKLFTEYSYTFNEMIMVIIRHI